jgi:hypothetical protein
MRKITSIAFAAVLATTASAAFAEQDIQKGHVGPVAMTDVQMDTVSAGQLIEVRIVDVANNNNVQVGIPINANVPVNAAILGRAFQASTNNQTGRVF